MKTTMTRRGLKSKLSGALIGAAACATGLALTAQAQTWTVAIGTDTTTGSYMTLTPNESAAEMAPFAVESGTVYPAWCLNAFLHIGLRGYNIEWYPINALFLEAFGTIAEATEATSTSEEQHEWYLENLPYVEYILKAWAMGTLGEDATAGNIQAALWFLLHGSESAEDHLAESPPYTGGRFHWDQSVVESLVEEAINAVDNGEVIGTDVMVWIGFPNVASGSLQPLATVTIGSPPGAGTPGYWKNHPEAWPVDGIDVGGIWYDKASAIEMMNRPVKGNKAVSLEFHLIAAKLNVLVGNPASCILDTIIAADAWLAQYGGERVTAGSAAWAEAAPLHQTLVDYNEGRLCAIHRDDLQTTDAATDAAKEHGKKPKK